MANATSTFGAKNAATSTFGTVHVDVDNTGAIAQSAPSAIQSAAGGLVFSGALSQVAAAAVQSAMGAVEVPLLDTYPGAVLALSLEIVRTGYSGSLIRVREDGLDTEADIGADANGNLDETALLSHCGSNNGYVTKWYDQHDGTAIDFPQTTAANQPQIISTGTVIKKGGSPAIFFSGDDRLTVAQEIIATQANSSVFVKVWTEQAGIANGRSPYSERSSGTPIWKIDAIDAGAVFGDSFGITHRDNSGTLTQAAANTAINDSAIHYLGLTKSGAAIKFFLDGNSDGTATLNGTDTITVSETNIGGDRVGGADWDDHILEVIVYASTLSDADAQALTGS